MARLRGEDGQAVPLLLGVLVVGLVFAMALSRVAIGAVDAARARTAADAAALAGAQSGRAAAALAAAENGGRLLAFRHVGHDVMVEVAVGVARAAARATLVAAPIGRRDE
jgi:hypothetical protein